MGTGPSTNEGERISVQILVLYEKLLQVHSIEKKCEQSMFILFLFCEFFIKQQKRLWLGIVAGGMGMCV